MSLADDVNATPHLHDTLCSGLRALKETDKSHISKKGSTKLAGSVDIDKALRPLYPNEHVWDYLVGANDGTKVRIHWIEIHPATSPGDITDIESKVNWLMRWMQSTPLAHYPRSVVWVASGRSAFNSRSPSLKKLANRGLSFAGSHLAI